MREFGLVVLTPGGLADPSIAIAASRAGTLGTLNLEFSPDIVRGRDALAALVRFTDSPFGLRLDILEPEFSAQMLAAAPDRASTLILANPTNAGLEHLVPQLRARGLSWLAEVTNLTQARLAWELGADGVIAKGHESGGWVGDETAFILLQRLMREAGTPVWLQGGIGLHTAAAAFVGGAAGVVLDWQLGLTREARLPDAVKSALRAMDGSETVCLGNELGLPFRVYSRAGFEAVQRLRSRAVELAGLPEAADAWRRSVAESTGLGNPAEAVWPMGQDAAFAASLADRFATVGGVVTALRTAVANHVSAAAELRPLDAHGPLAARQGHTYPIAQGPMTRVSDTAAFALQVAEGGGLPFLALALMRAPEVEALLHETQELLGDRPWGVGILGFVPLELRQEQLAVIHMVRPPYALIAGGRPDQAHQLDAAGIPTYLHVPSPGLLKLFLQDGARRFVFEGRECGGHVGPRSSFVLWDSMIDVLLSELGGDRLKECQLLFAGGIHDATSAAMVAAAAAPLAALGAQIGVLMGTAYLVTEEAVSAGAILPGFQIAALECEGTVLLESGTGHETRAVPTPFVQVFNDEKLKLLRQGKDGQEVRLALEELNIGRLRIAAKGIKRAAQGATNGAHRYDDVDQAEQRLDGLYMIGQVAALREHTTTIAALHEEVSVGSSRLLDELTSIEPADTTPRAKPAEIAIVGMGGLLPAARNLKEFWENVLAGRSAIGEVPKERWDWELYFDADRNAQDKIYSRWGGFIADTPFDPLEFGIPPNSLASIDPVHLLCLLVARDTLADAGYATRPFDRSRTAVILGGSGGTGDLGARYLLRSGLPLLFGKEGFRAAEESGSALPAWTEDSFAGLLLNVAAGRVANRLDLGGANFVVDAACASSLAAVHLAAKELQTGDADMVLVGGFDTVNNPFGYLCFSKTQALSPTGEARVFDAAGDGIVISEGVVMLALKRLADAERDGDRIYAVIQGVGASSDGRALGLTAPRPEGQILAFERAYAQAGIDPTTVELFEAHGTGTVVGDRTEASSLSRFLASRGAGQAGHAIGSVKSMIGHTKASAGVAGLVKVALALHHKVLPPTYGVTKPNQKAGFGTGPLYVNSQARPWIHGRDTAPRRAAVSAFGFGGTNFHAVLEEYQGDYLAETGERQATVERWPAELLIWRGPDRESIAGSVDALRLALENGATPELRNVAFSLWQVAASAEGTTRLAVVAESIAELPAKLGRVASALRTPAVGEHFDPTGIYFGDDEASREGKLAFLFPGQGSQYVNMGRDLALYFPEVRAVLERTDSALAAQFDNPLSRFVYPPPAFTPEDERAQLEALTQTNVAQPALGGVDSGVLALLDSLGLAADLVAGHSYGEYVALYAAGSIDLETLAFLSEARGRAIVEAARGDLGTMAAARAGAPAVSAALAGMPEVWVANLNAPNQTVISGTKMGIAAAVERLAAAGITARPLPVACAFHSPLMAPAQERLAGALEKARISAPSLPVYSNTTAAAHEPDPVAIRAALSRHLLEPVRFADEIESMYAAGARIFLEVGPGTVLTGLADQVLGERPHRAIATDAQKRNGLAQLLHALGQLAVLGIDFRLDRLFAGRQTRAIDLVAPATPAREDGHAASMWLVNGTRARPASAPPEAAARPPLEGRLLMAGQVASAPVTGTNGAAQPAGQHGPPAPVVTGPAAPFAESEQVMLLFQQTMARFVETQKNVMLAYLQGNTGAEPQALFPAAATSGLVLPESGAALNGSVGAAGVAPDDAPPDGQLGASTHAEAFSQERLTQELLRIVGERTGYPPEMLDLDVDIEAQLGIDSIKRVEILGTVQRECLPPDRCLPADAMERLTHVKTLRGIADWIGMAVIASGNGSGKHDETVDGATGLPDRAGAGSIPRSAPILVSLPPLPVEKLKIVSGGLYLVTDDGRGVATAVADRLKAAGAQVVLVEAPGAIGRASVDGSLEYLALDLGDGGAVDAALAALRQAHGAVAGIIHLLPLAAHEAGEIDLQAWRERGTQQVKGFFHLARASAADLRGSQDGSPRWLIAATGLGGRFGYGRPAPDLGLAGQGGLLGMIKALALEWPETLCRAVDVDPTLDPALLADLILRETLAGGPAEVGIAADGSRVSVAPALAPLELGERSLQISDDWVILVTGGARGITAEAATYLARRYGPTLLLAGSAPPPPEQESPLTAGLTGTREVKAALIDELKREGGEVSLAEVERRHTSLLKEREIRANIAAMRSAGARVSYFQTDLRNEADVRTLMEAVYSGWGRLDAWIHGAGVIEDKLAQEKSPESFARVFDTKADSAFLISRYVRSDSLRLAAFFSSASGFFGNRGQADYAAANEVLNKLALHLDASWPGRVVAINWGPWLKTGMVSDELQREFVRRGIRLIPVDVGCALLDDEIAFGRKGQPVVVLAGGSWGAGDQGPAGSGEGTGAGTPEQPALDTPLTPPKFAGGPLVAGRYSVNPIAGGVEVRLTLNPEEDRYLQDHVIDGNPVFPFAMALELAAEVAQVGWPDLHVTAFRDFGVLKGLVLSESSLPLRVVARAHPEAPTERVGIDVLVEIFEAGDPARPHYRGTLELSDRPLATVAVRQAASNGAGLIPLPKSVEEIYADWLFHGPMFRGIAEFSGISSDRLVATLTPSDAAALVSGAVGNRWLLDPVVFDSALQMIIVWVRLHADATPLPARFRRYTRYGSLGSGPVTARLSPSAGGGVTDAVDIDFIGSDGSLLGRLEQMETAFSRALNRLGGSQHAAR